MLGYDLRTESLKIKREVGYMTQKFSFYEDLTIAENLDFVARLYRLKPVARACRPDARGPRPDLAARPARRHAVRRLEAAAGARRLHHAQAEAAAARRADRRRRPQGAARILGRDPPAGARRADRAGLDPLHGRGRALPPHQLHLLRQDAGERHGRRGGAECRVSPPSSSTGRGSTGSPKRCRARPGVDQVAPFGTTLHVVGSDARQLEAALDDIRKTRRHQGRARRDQPRGRVHPVHVRLARTTWHERDLLASPGWARCSPRNSSRCGATASPSR